MKILQLSYRVPFPPNDGGAIGIYNIVKGYSDAGHDVTLLSINTPKHFQNDTVLASICTQINISVNTNLNPVKAFINLFNSKPYNVARFISKDVELKIEAVLSKNNFDAIHIDGVFMAHYIHVIRLHAKCPVIIRTHNIEYVIWERLAKGEGSLLKKWYLNLLAKRLKQYEITHYNLFDGIAAITNEDALRLRELGVSKPQIVVIPAGVAENHFLKTQAPAPEANTIFSISSLDWMPNQEAINWFLNEIWPAVYTAFPQIQLHIAGKATPEKLLKLQIPNVTIHGMVPDAIEFMQHYDIMIVPLLSGGGMRLKIIEAMALGKCIISSSIGAEGIECSNGKNIIICDNVIEWVNAIGKCINNSAYKNSIGEEALHLANTHYKNSAITQKYIQFINALIAKKQ